MKLNLANFLTLLRIAAIPVVVVCFYSPLDYARPIAAVLFGLAAVTDMIDGWVARRFGQIVAVHNGRGDARGRAPFRQGGSRTSSR